MKKMTRLHFGPSGIPHSTEERTTGNGIKRVAAMGLDAMELAFVQTVYLKSADAPAVKQLADSSDVILTAHGQYFINLNAKEPEKLAASRQRILTAARRCHEAGAYSMTFHPAFYLGDASDVVQERVTAEMKKIMAELKDEGNEVWVRPETTGKATQFGDLKELVKLSTQVEGVLPCIDFSHLHARNGGGNNSTEEFRATLTHVEQQLGRMALDNMHIHVSGIAYGPKGEKHHLNLVESDMQYQDLVKVWKEFNLKGCIISESPNQEDDAKLLQELWKKK